MHPVSLHKLARCSFHGVTLAGLLALAGCGGGGSSTITPPTPNPTTVTFDFNRTGQAPPTLVAARIGAGTFTAQSLTSGKLTLSVPSGETRFSVAYFCPGSAVTPQSPFVEYIDEETLSDGTSFSRSCFQTQTVGATGLATLKVDPSAIPGAAFVNFDNVEYLPTNSDLNFSQQMAVGTHDFTITVLDSDFKPLAARVLRAQTIPGSLNGGAPVVFTVGDEVVPQTITYNNVPGGFTVLRPFIDYLTPDGAYVALFNQTTPITPLLKMPAAEFQTGDYYFLGTQAQDASFHQGVGFETYSTSSGPETASFPGPWSYAGPTPAALPTFDFVYSGFQGKLDVFDYINLSWNSDPSKTNQIIVTASGNYQGQSTSLTVPDLSTVPGFLPSPASGVQVGWGADIFQGKLSTTGTPSGTVQYVFTNGQYNQP